MDTLIIRLYVTIHPFYIQAAEMIHISQPSLTATLKRMENNLGHELFIRATKTIKITEKGIQFYRHAVRLVEAYHQTMEKMYDLNIRQSPKIKVSILESMSRWMPTVIQSHNRLYPGRHYQVLEVDRFEAATNFVNQRMGYAVIPRLYYQSSNTDELNIIKVRPAIKRTIYMNTLKKRKHSEEELSPIEYSMDFWDIER